MSNYFDKPNSMIKNYLIIAVRNLLKDKFFSILNISGLAVGLACFLLIGIYIQYEYSYDKHWVDGERIYRVGTYMNIPSQGGESYIPAATGLLAPYIEENCPQIESVARVMGHWQGDFSYKENAFHETNLYVVDKEFFPLFGIECLQGSYEQMDEPNKIILTRNTALRYFGEEDPIQKVIKWGDGDYTVIGVVENPPVTSHLQYDFLIPLESVIGNYYLNWANIGFYTYVKFHPGADIDKTRKDLSEMYGVNIQGAVEEFFNVTFEEAHFEFYFENVLTIHLDAKDYEGGSSTELIQLRILMATAISILILACVNYVNLSSAASLKRAREIALRKASGGQRSAIVVQFLCESVLVSLFALGLALLITKLSLPFFNSIIGNELKLIYISKIEFTSIALIFAILLGIAAGSFPAFIVSRFPVIESLKGKMRSGKQGHLFRKIMVGFQLGLAFIIVFSAILLDRQFMYFMNKDVGYNKENLLVMQSANEIFKKRDMCREELLKNPNILGVTFQSAEPGKTNEGSSFQIQGHDPSELVNMDILRVDNNYLSTYGLSLVAGRFLSDDPADSMNVVVNEKCVSEYNIENPIGAVLIAPNPDKSKQYFTIVGVVKDYSVYSVKIPIYPVMFRNSLPTWTNFMCLRYRPGAREEVLQELRKMWDEHASTSPFDHETVCESLDRFITPDRIARKIFLTFSLLTIFISCMGILGLIFYTTSLRTKEIGIRKVNGSGIFQIIFLLSKNSLLICCIAIVVSTPLAYLLAQSWMDTLYEKMPLSPWIFVAAGCILLFVTFLTEAIVTIRAALKNPVEALRYE